MTFDYVVGNPPYDDKGGPNKKLWKTITRKVQGLAKRQIVFITPIAQLNYLLKKFTFYIDYTTDDYFNVKVKTAAWGMNATPVMNRTTYSSDGTIDGGWVNAPERAIEAEFSDLKKTPGNKRLFKRQAITDSGLCCVKNALRGTTAYCTSYVIPEGRKVLAIPLSRTLTRENIIISHEKYGSLYVQIDITDWVETQIETFIEELLHPGFVEYCRVFKLFYGTGFNNVLIYTDSTNRRLPKE